MSLPPLSAFLANPVTSSAALSQARRFRELTAAIRRLWRRTVDAPPDPGCRAGDIRRRALDRIYRARMTMGPRHNGNRGPDTPEYHVGLVVRHMRRLLDLGHTIEDNLDLVLQAARQEFQCCIFIKKPLVFLVDGGEFIWPLTAGTQANCGNLVAENTGGNGK